MPTGLWSAASGAAAQAHRVDTVANNLANSDTNGFKKDTPAFREYLATLERDAGPQEVPRGPIKDKDLHPLDSRDLAYVTVDGTYTSFKPGHLRVTQNALDVALDGPGFLEVSTPQGSRFTRQGSLKLAMDGRLVTTEGYPVLSVSNSTGQPGQARLPAGAGTQGGVAAGLGLDGQPIAGQIDASRAINLRDRVGSVSISPTGELFVGQDRIAQLSIVEFKDPQQLMKVGGLLFENTDPTNAVNAQKTQIKQGMLETSNVNPVEEMTNLIKANRMFEHDLKVMKTFGELMGREANDIGKL